MLSELQKTKLGNTLATLVESYPTFPNLRGIILDRAKLYIPPEVPDTGLADYIAANLKVEPVVEKVNSVGSTIAAALERDPLAFWVEYSATENVSGRSYFTRSDTVGGSYRIRESFIKDLCEEHDYDVDAIVEAIEEEIKDTGDWNTIEHGDEEYNDSENTDSDGRDDMEFKRLTTLVEEWIEAHLQPEATEEPQPAPEATP